MMTRQHFEAVAAALAATRPEHDDFTTTSAVGNNTMHNGIAYKAARKTWTRTRDAIATTFYASNPRFDRGRFERATEV